MENKKVFIDAKFNKNIFRSYIFVLIAFFLSHFFGGIEAKRFLFNLFLLTIVYFIYRKDLLYKIITDAHGISRLDLIKRVHASWNEVISIKQSSLNPNLFKLKTKKGDFSFTLYVKEKEAIYPKLKTLWKGKSKWVYENGVEKEITLENCPLYIEIQEHLENK